jgi:cation:H+ antiporter
MFGLTLLVIGLAGLWAGTHLTLSGAVRLCERRGLSQTFVGLTVLAIGTDLPELLVALSGSAQQLQGVDASGVIVGNAIGSAIAQGSLVIGVAGLFGYLRIAPRMVRRDGSTLLLAIALTAALSIDGRVDRMEGMALVIGYMIYFVALVQAEHRRKKSPKAAAAGRLPDGVLIVAGLVTVTLASHVVVVEAMTLAQSWGVSQTLLGVLVLGLGTSVPELVLSVGAVTKGHGGLAMGNVIGSNIFDLLVPVGVAALLHPLLVAGETTSFDLPALALGTVALLLFAMRKRGLQRSEAISLVAIYVGYATLRVMIG